MKRPVPVVLSAIFLGFLAALKLLVTLSMVTVGFLVLHRGLPQPTPTPTFPPSFLPILFFGMAILAAAAAAWSILTLVGLLRMRSWARYSVLVIAGLMAGFGAILTLTSFAMPFLASQSATQPAADPHLLHGIFFVTGTIYAVFAAIGIALLVYYNLANTRALFLQNAPVNFDPPNTSTGRPRPTAITVISWIYLISWPFCLIYAFLPFPAFLFGFVLYGFAAHVTYAAIGSLTFAIGYGLLRLREEARLAVFALFALCPIQLLVVLTPWGAGRFKLYMDALNAKIYAGQQVPPNFASSPHAIAFFLLLSTALYAMVLWLLHRHRESFTPGPPPPSMPTYPEPIAALTS